VLQYGSYNEEEYKSILKNSRFGIWIGSHESQGFALQEALSTNTPLLVWDVSSMFDEIYNGSMEYMRYQGSKKLLATSCTTWDNTCGIRFTRSEDAEQSLDTMLANWNTFQPRKLIFDTLHPITCLQRMMDVSKKIPSDGIIPWLGGGLGNQMFIIIASWLASKLYSCPLYLLQNNMLYNKHSSKNYKLSIFKHIGTHSSDEFSSKMLSTLESNGYKIFDNNNSNSFAKYSIEHIPPPVIYKNYFQYYPPMKDHEHEIRSLLLQGLSEISIPGYNSFEEGAFLHIRRGDYIPVSHIHPICPLSYYKDALSRLSTMSSTKDIHIVSDDMAWVKIQSCWSEFGAQFGFTFHFHDMDELSSMKLMSLCKGGAICANSSFSWWGAFLGAYSTRAPVFVPKNWLTLFPYVALFPEEWTVLA
jgi:hypothetical protein